MKKRTIGILAILAAAGASVFALAQGTLTPETAPAIPDTPSPIAAAPSQPCAYTWAYENLPDVTAELQAAQDGSATFSAMETDFYLRIPVADLNDDETLGSFVEQVLSITDRFASPRIPGPKEGFVEFTFLNETEQRIVRVQIPLGKQMRGQGLHGAELLKALETP
jgi:hypothetical protein